MLTRSQSAALEAQMDPSLVSTSGAPGNAANAPGAPPPGGLPPAGIPSGTLASTVILSADQWSAIQTILTQIKEGRV